MKKVVIGVMALVLCLGIAACSSDDANKKDGEKTETKKEEKKVYKVGDTAKVGDITIKVNKTRIDKGYTPADKGKVYFVLDVTLKNNSKEAFSSSSIICYKLKDGDNREVTTSIGANLNGSLDTKIEPGESGTGEIAYEVAKSGKLTFTFIPDAFSDDNVRFEVR